MAKTHWKKVVSDPNFIGEADFAEGEEKVLTLDYVNHNETITTAEGKSQKAVAHWKEPGNKPMILNVERSKAMEKVAGSPYFEDWVGVKFQLFVKKGIRAFGEIVNAVRVRPYKPRMQTETPIPKCTDCGGEIKPGFGKDARGMATYTTKNYGVPLCAACAQKRKASQSAPAEETKVEETNVEEGIL